MRIGLRRGDALLASIHAYQFGNWLQRKWAVLRHRWWSVVCAADIPLTTNIGSNVSLPHPCGIVVHPLAIIGPDCLLMSGVVVGQSHWGSGVPYLGRHVDVGSGAKLLGGILVGDDVMIGANAVVLADVPPNTTVVGVWK